MFSTTASRSATKMSALVAVLVVGLCISSVAGVRNARLLPEEESRMGGSLVFNHLKEVAEDEQTALDRYLKMPDPEYKWVDTGRRIDGTIPDMTPDDHWTGYVLRLTSQRWLTDANSSCSLWEHDLVVIIPKVVSEPSNLETAQFYVTGDNGPPGNLVDTDEDIYFTADLVQGTHSVGMALFQVPQGYCTFPDDPTNTSRNEDSFIAFTWRQYIDLKRAGDPNADNWLARLPMVKAAVRAMDATQEFLSQCTDCATQGQVPKNFIVYGASKRGWTSWLTGAVDSRVIGIAPIVMDALNMNALFHRWWQSLGGWSFATWDYFTLGLFSEVDTPEFASMAAIIDPINYKNRLADVPKLVVTSSNDEFFMPYDNHLWWDEMPGVKHSLIAVNADHRDESWTGMTSPSMIAWANGIMHNNKAANPELAWNTWYTTDGQVQTAHLNVTLTLGEGALKPTNVSVIYTYSDANSNRIDFRWYSKDKTCQGPTTPVHDINLCVHPYPWMSTPLAPVESTETSIHYTTSMPAPSSHTEGSYGAFFVQFMFPGVTEGILQYPLVVNTQVALVPNTLPFPDCSGAGCGGSLI